MAFLLCRCAHPVGSRLLLLSFRRPVSSLSNLSPNRGKLYSRAQVQAGEHPTRRQAENASVSYKHMMTWCSGAGAPGCPRDCHLVCGVFIYRKRSQNFTDIQLEILLRTANSTYWILGFSWSWPQPLLAVGCLPCADQVRRVLFLVVVVPCKEINMVATPQVGCIAGPNLLFVRSRALKFNDEIMLLI